MATPVMLKKIDEKKLAAQKRREKQQQDHLLPLGGMSNAPSDHLLIRENPNPVPRMIDLQPLSSQFTQYRQRKTTDFAVDRPIGLNYTSFETNSGSGTSNFDYQELYQPQPYIQQPNYHSNSYGYNKPMSLQKGNFNRKTKMQILEPPADMNMVEYTIRANNLVCFHGKTHFLSSLYREDITIDGHTYLSVEHYYQACKVFTLLGPTQAQMLRGEQDSLKVKNKAKQILQSNGVNTVTIDQWKNTKGLLVLLHGTRHKFNNVELRKKLMATGDALLCQAYDRADNLYAVGMSEQELREWASENEGKVLKVPAELTEDEVKYLPLIGKGKNILGIICMQVRNEIRDKKENVGPTEEVTGDKKAQEESRGSSPKTSSDGTNKDEETGLGVVKEEDDATKLAQQINAALYAGFGEEPISTPKK